MGTEIPESIDGFWAKSLFFVADSAGWVCFGLVYKGLTGNILFCLSKGLCPASKRQMYQTLQ